MIKRLSFICALAVILAAMSARTAKADGMDTYTYVSDGNTFVWQLPSSPTPDSVDPYGDYFTISALYSENDAVPVLGTFDFYTLSEFGGLDLYQGAYPPPSYLINAGFGRSVFMGSINAPTFVPDLTPLPITRQATMVFRACLPSPVCRNHRPSGC